MQGRSDSFWVRLPILENQLLCPTRALFQLLNSRCIPQHYPLFAQKITPHKQVTDTLIRSILKQILNILSVDHTPLGFHAFRRSGATLAFDNHIPLQNIMAHGQWKSDAIWTYLEKASVAPSLIPQTFSRVIPRIL